jgi:glycosyltransferase involved in cell wall biosynthesis
MLHSSKVGVAIPTYNRDAYLRRLLNSIPENIDVLISDNGNYCSAEFRSEFKQHRFIGSNTVLDVIRNWNNAVENLNTEWVCVASDDDIFYPNAFALFEEYQNKYPTADVIIFGHQNIDEDDTPLDSWKIESLKICDPPEGYDIFRYGVDARVIGVFFKKALYNKIGKFDERYKVTASDSDFIQRALINGKAVIVPEVVVGYRVWSRNMTSQLSAARAWMEEVILWQSKIALELRQINYPEKKIMGNTDEVIARNLLSGVYSLLRQRKSLTTAVQYIRQFKYPAHAKIHTQIKLLKCLLRIALKI